MTDPIAIKLGLLFEAVDADHDGTIHWADYQRLFDRLAVGYKTDTAERRLQALQATYQMYWCELLRHADSTSPLLTKEEFVAVNRMASMDISRFNVVEGIPSAMFDVIVPDDSNILGMEELSRLLKLLEVTSPEIAGRIPELGNDGCVTREDCVRSAREFFYTPNVIAPGGVFFGMV
ncbi:EF-hand domain-containing protein [Streptomyces sp. NPDC057743]|uniref:EF-hand domain-containing protein n=1 Tax=Streptomyces sp. NPDC057743 TaxID=3346236 RepID=UPI0036907049